MTSESLHTTLDLTSLAEKTFFLSLKFSAFGNFRKADLQIVSEAIETRFKHQKQLIDSPELKAIAKADNELKTTINHLCLPANFDTGIRFLPKGNVEVAHKLLKEYRDVARPALVKTLVYAWDDLVKQAEIELKEEFNINNYPTSGEVAAHFAFEFQFLSFGTPSNLKEFAPDIYAEEIEKAKKIYVDAANDVVVAYRTLAYELVQKLADSLSPEKNNGKSKKLHDSHVDKLKDFIASSDIMNVGNDQELKGHLKNLALLMEGVDADKIRHSDTLKTDLSAKIGEIATTMSNMAQVKGRLFRDEPVFIPTADPI